MNKELCNCGRVAVWCYAPCHSNGDNPYYCDDCVRRGCDCNHMYVSEDSYYPTLDNPLLPEGEEGKDWKWLKKDEVWVHIDDEGREYPCAEYFYDEDGWELDNE